MQIDATTAIAATPATEAPATAARVGLADSFDSFLKLLTAQLAAQDPLAPMDANQFTEQLVQFTGVEQAIKTNEAIGQLVALMQGQQMARAVDYLGAEVEAGGDSLRLGAEGSVQAHYQLDQAAAAVAIRIVDASGRQVAQLTGPTGAGGQQVTWDGRDQSGTRLPEGLYRVQVVATDAAGQPVPSSNRVTGIVDGVEMVGDQLLLSLDGALVPLDAVTAIRRPITI
jgi:flagellar basal-body rod modification protein FlgD